MGLIIFGVDPGSRVTGFGVVEADDGSLIHRHHGVIVLEENATFAERMGQLAVAMRELLQKHRPQQVVLEKIFLGKNADSAFKLGHARGVLMAEAAQVGIPVAEYAARQVKKGVSGNGGSSKEEIQLVVQNLLGIHGIQRLDASDALALACYHAFEARKKALLRRAMEL